MMTVFSRSAMLSAGFVLTGLLSACSGGGSDGAAPQSQQQPESQANSSVSVENPKDASRGDICGLLPPDAAKSIGMKPDGFMDDSPNLDSDAPEACLWESAEGDKSVSLGPVEGRSIQEYYDNKATYADYGELEISGYPAVRANQGDPAQDGYCAMFLATDERQLLYAYGSDSNMTDSCGLAQKALEASVPTLPAAG